MSSISSSRQPENPSASSVLAEQYQILEDSSAASSEFCEKFWSLQQLLRSEGVVEGGKSVSV
tara:strand:- start:1563 stop:1748 length:186 start_codon:yes stop_codon:yes gene_type:complete